MYRKWLLVAASLQIISFVCETGEINVKIVEGNTIQRYGFQTTETHLSLRKQPERLIGPDVLKPLNGTCFKEHINGYIYSVCPMQNVTQKEEAERWGSFYGVLGVFTDWIIENETFVGMFYTMGESCANLQDREIKVYFVCDTVTKLANASEPEKCQYRIELHSPLVCLQHVMKVQHLFTDDMYMRWSEVEDMHKTDLLTLQGLQKKKKQLLQNWKILYQKPKQEEKIKKKDAIIQHVDLEKENKFCQVQTTFTSFIEEALNLATNTTEGNRFKTQGRLLAEHFNEYCKEYNPN